MRPVEMVAASPLVTIPAEHEEKEPRPERAMCLRALSTGARVRHTDRSGGTDSLGEPAVNESKAMIDRDKVLDVLNKRFPGASRQQVAWAANALIGLDDEWQLVAWNETEIEGSDSCGRWCDVADRIREGTEFRMFQKRPADVRS